MSKTAKKSNLFLKILLPILILAAGAILFVLLMKMKAVPEKRVPVQQGVLVTVTELQAADQPIIIRTSGTVQAEQEISLVPEVSGKVNWISPKLVSGGLFEAGELMLAISARDYQLAVEQAQSGVAAAEVALAKEKELAWVSLEEWAKIELPDKGEPGPLVTREIQLQQQKAALSAAQATLEQARLNLERTAIKAPFNGRIRAEQVDFGQYLRAGNSIATFSGTDRAEIHVSLSETELAWLEVPRTATQQGSEARITIAGNDSRSRSGQIIRSLGEIDASNRMATVIVRVDDPYLLQPGATGTALLNGQFVELEFHGQTLKQAISIPRRALHPGDVVWLADANKRLQIRPVTIAHRSEDEVILSSGLASGEQLILTNLSAAAEGTLLRPVIDGQEQTDSTTTDDNSSETNGGQQQ